MTHTRESLSKKISTHRTTLIMVQNVAHIPRSSVRTRAGRTRTGSDILVSVRTFIILLLLILLYIRPRTRAHVRPLQICPTPSVSVELCLLRPPQNGTSSASAKNLHRAPIPYLSFSDVPCPPSGYSWFRFLTAG